MPNNLSPEEAAKQFIASIPPEKLEIIKQSLKSEYEKLLKIEADKLASMESEKQALVEKREATWNKQMEAIGDEKYNLMRENNEVYKQIEFLNASLLNQKNRVLVLKNGGDLNTITDLKGMKHADIPDFSQIATEQIIFNEETILTDPVPVYIPFIDESVFKSKGFTLDAIRVGSDNYLTAIKEHSEKESADYVILTLDQLVLTNDFYFTKAKALLVKDAEESTAKQEKYWDSLPETRRETFLNQKNLYHSLPVAIKKKISQFNYEALSWQEKEKIYKFFKRYGAKRLASKLDEHHMWSSLHLMYERFVNPEAKEPKPRFAHPEVWAYWEKFRDMLKWKIKDIRIQREDISDIRKAALETSFGESNTDNALKEKFGILVKRQNGSKINAIEINEIETAWEQVQSVFGNLKTIAESSNMKVSHTGNRFVFANKALGMYVYTMGTIAISNKYGELEFKNSLAHEIAHWIDQKLGEKQGKRWATDNYESTSGKIAFAFRDNLNTKTDSDYVNATKECFARAFEQYFAVTNQGDEATILYSFRELDKRTPYFTADNYVGKTSFETVIKPLINTFFEENKDFFKYAIGDIQKTENMQTISNEKVVKIKLEGKNVNVYRDILAQDMTDAHNMVEYYQNLPSSKTQELSEHHGTTKAYQLEKAKEKLQEKKSAYNEFGETHIVTVEKNDEAIDSLLEKINNHFIFLRNSKIYSIEDKPFTFDDINELYYFLEEKLTGASLKTKTNSLKRNKATETAKPMKATPTVNSNLEKTIAEAERIYEANGYNLAGHVAAVVQTGENEYNFFFPKKDEGYMVGDVQADTTNIIVKIIEPKVYTPKYKVGDILFDKDSFGAGVHSYLLILKLVKDGYWVTSYAKQLAGENSGSFTVAYKNQDKYTLYNPTPEDLQRWGERIERMRETFTKLGSMAGDKTDALAEEKAYLDYLEKHIVPKESEPKDYIIKEEKESYSKTGVAWRSYEKKTGIPMYSGAETKEEAEEKLRTFYNVKNIEFIPLPKNQPISKESQAVIKPEWDKMKDFLNETDKKVHPENHVDFTVFAHYLEKFKYQFNKLIYPLELIIQHDAKEIEFYHSVTGSLFYTYANGNVTFVKQNKDVPVEKLEEIIQHFNNLCYLETEMQKQQRVYEYKELAEKLNLEYKFFNIKDEIPYFKEEVKLSEKMQNYINELSSMIGTNKANIESFIKGNNLTENEVLNIVEGIGRKHLIPADVTTAIIGNKGNDLEKELLEYAKSDKAFKAESKPESVIPEPVIIPEVPKTDYDLSAHKLKVLTWKDDVSDVTAKKDDKNVYFYFNGEEFQVTPIADVEATLADIEKIKKEKSGDLTAFLPEEMKQEIADAQKELEECVAVLNDDKAETGLAYPMENHKIVIDKIPYIIKALDAYKITISKKEGKYNKPEEKQYTYDELIEMFNEGRVQFANHDNATAEGKLEFQKVFINRQLCSVKKEALHNLKKMKNDSVEKISELLMNSKHLGSKLEKKISEIDAQQIKLQEKEQEIESLKNEAKSKAELAAQERVIENNIETNITDSVSWNLIDTICKKWNFDKDLFSKLFEYPMSFNIEVFASKVIPASLNYVDIASGDIHEITADDAKKNIKKLDKEVSKHISHWLASNDYDKGERVDVNRIMFDIFEKLELLEQETCFSIINNLIFTQTIWCFKSDDTENTVFELRLYDNLKDDIYESYEYVINKSDGLFINTPHETVNQFINKLYEVKMYANPDKQISDDIAEGNVVIENGFPNKRMLQTTLHYVEILKSEN